MDVSPPGSHAQLTGQHSKRFRTKLRAVQSFRKNPSEREIEKRSDCSKLSAETLATQVARRPAGWRLACTGSQIVERKKIAGEDGKTGAEAWGIGEKGIPRPSLARSTFHRGSIFLPLSESLEQAIDGGGLLILCSGWT